jgi:Cytochrome P460
VASVIASTAPAAGRADEEATPIFGIKIFPGYRDWRLISVAHEAGNVNDIRAILGNDVAIKAYRQGKRPSPDGTVIARIAWTKIPSQENNKAFGPERQHTATLALYGGRAYLACAPTAYEFGAVARLAYNLARCRQRVPLFLAAA